MSSQKGNASRSRGQKYQNSVSFRNDKYGATVQVKVREPHANFLSLAALSGLFAFKLTLQPKEYILKCRQINIIHAVTGVLPSLLLC